MLLCAHDTPSLHQSAGGNDCPRDPRIRANRSRLWVVEYSSSHCDHIQADNDHIALHDNGAGTRLLPRRNHALQQRRSCFSCGRIAVDQPDEHLGGCRPNTALHKRHSNLDDEANRWPLAANHRDGRTLLHHRLVGHPIRP